MRAAIILVAGCSEYEVGGAGVVGTPSAPEPESIPTSRPLEPPIADAGPDQVRAPLDEAILDATRSYDPGGFDIVEVDWTLIQRPAGSTAKLSDPTVPRPELFLDLAGTYRLSLTVRNRAGLWDPTPDEVEIEALPAQSFYVQLSWDAGNDLDLHLLEGDSGLFGPGDCNYCNLSPRWGAAGPLDDPSLDWDAIFGYGPETITIDEPASGSYHIMVHYFGENGTDRCEGSCAESVATVLVYVDGLLAAKFARTLSQQGDLWDVGTISWPEGTPTEIDSLGFTSQRACH
jgi:hypothetical protein